MRQAAVGNVEDGEGALSYVFGRVGCESQRVAELEEGVSLEADVRARFRGLKESGMPGTWPRRLCRVLRALRWPRVLARLNTTASLNAW